MLHIILAILKITGIVLAVLLLLVLLLLLICLFGPFRYHVQLQKTGGWKEAKVCAAVRWIFGAVSVEGGYESGKTVVILRILWIKKYLAGEQTHSASEKTEREKTPGKKKKSERTAENKSQSKKTAKEQLPEKENRHQKQDQSQEESLPEPVGIPENQPHRSWHAAEETENIKKTQHLPSFSGIRDKTAAFFRRLYKGVQDLINSLCEKQKEMGESIRFLRSQTTKEVFQILKEHIFYLLHHIRPRKAKGNLHYGFEDPSLTGQLSGILYLLLPARWNCVVLQPDFENQVLEGELYLAGHIRVCHIVKVALQIFFDKKLKSYWNKFKQLRRN